MISSLANIFKVPDLRKKILFVLFIIGLYRLGTHVPVPGIDFDALERLRDEGIGGIANLVDFFSGGALERVSVFSLGIMPAITASIIIQLLTVVIPKFEQWREEGESGQKKITQWTRYLTLILAVIQSSGFVYLFSQGQITPGGGGGSIDILGPGNHEWWRYGLMVLTMTTGTVLVMWLGELISQRGIGNGMSLLIFASVVSALPSEGNRIWQQNPAQFFVILMIFFAMIVAIVFIESGERRIHVQFAKRIVGRRQTQGGSTYIPLKVNTGGVIPVIFASSILTIPALILSVVPSDGWGESLRSWVENNLQNQTSPVYVLSYFLLVIGFSYFYNMIQFDPWRQADFLKKQGGYIPGVRPGDATANYFSRILNRLTLPGALYLAFVALVPLVVLAVWNVSAFTFGGVSLLITVGVALETMKQIDSQLTMRNYEGFLSMSRSK